MVSFNVSRDDAQTIQDIVDRAMLAARRLNVRGLSRMELSMDLTAAHANGMPLRLDELLRADDEHFAHDVFGIRRHIDRTTGELRDCFVPRYARPQAA